MSYIGTKPLTEDGLIRSSPYPLVSGRLGYRPPAPEVFVPAFTAWPAALTRSAPPAKLPVEQRPTLH